MSESKLYSYMSDTHFGGEQIMTHLSDWHVGSMTEGKSNFSSNAWKRIGDSFSGTGPVSEELNKRIIEMWKNMADKVMKEETKDVSFEF